MISHYRHRSTLLGFKKNVPTDKQYTNIINMTISNSKFLQVQLYERK